MPKYNRLYLHFYFGVMFFYLLFNKGVAYTFLAEIVLVIGVLMIFLQRKQFEFYINKKYSLIFLLCFLTIFYILFGILKYNFINVIRDSFAIEYALFAILLYFFK